MAHSQQEITSASGDFFEFTYDGETIFVAASNGTDAADNYADGEFSLDTSSTLTLIYVKKSGVYQGEFSVAPGDVIRFTFETNGDVTIKRNGTLVHTFVNPPKTFPYRLVFKTSETAGWGISDAATSVGVSGPPVPPDSLDTYAANTDRVLRSNYALTGSRDLTQPNRGAGYVFTDALYGSRVLRVTDGSSTLPEYNNRSFVNPSSAETKAWNSDGTKFYVLMGGAAFIWNFDAANFTVSRPGNTSNFVKGLSLLSVSTNEPFWSYINPNILYSTYVNVIRKFDLSTVTGTTNTPPSTDPVDLAAIYSTITGGGTLTGPLGLPMLSNTDPEIITLSFGGDQNTWRYVLWYNLGTNQYKVLDLRFGTTGKCRVYNSQTGTWTDTAYDGGWGSHNARIDKTGRYVIPTRGDGGSKPATESLINIWDTQNDTVVNLLYADRPEGHVTTGFGYFIDADADSTGGGVPYDSVQWWIRPLSNLTAESRLVIPNLIEGGTESVVDWYSDEHAGWHNSRPGSFKPIVTATFRADPVPPGTIIPTGHNYVAEGTIIPWRAWDGEIIGVRTDGVQSTVWRFFQHHGVTWNTPGGYEGKRFGEYPIIQLSQDGRYAYVSTNWGLTLGNDSEKEGLKRKDVFIVELGIAPPTNLRFVTTSSCNTNSVTGYLTWFDNSHNEAGFVIESRTQSNGVWGAWGQAATVGANITNSGSLTVTAVTQYRVKAVNAPAEPSYSDTLTAPPVNSCEASSTPPTGPGLIIGEFRLRGPAGEKDEFVEFYNNTDAAITVRTADTSGGWTLAARGVGGASASPVFTVPNGTVIPARGHYLAVNNGPGGYSLSGHPAGNGATATGDISYNSDIEDNVGIALFNTANPANFTSAHRLDAAGSTAEADALYREGAGYPPLSGSTYTAGLDYSFYRDTCGKSGSITTFGVCPTGGAVMDSGDNAADFIYVDTLGSNVGAGQRLGAPGPENLSSPVVRNSTIAAALLDPCVSGSSPPNRLREFESGNPNTSTFGTLDLHYTFTNNTGANVTRLRFRVIDLTTWQAPPGVADLRPLSSTDAVVIVDRAPCGAGSSNVTVRGTTLEESPAQLAGGGFNSTLSAGSVTVATPLAPGASIDLRFRLGIQHTGNYKFYLNVEALP